MPALWNIKVGDYIYKTKISLSYACEIAEKLQDEVLGIQISRQTEIEEAGRMVEAG